MEIRTLVPLDRFQTDPRQSMDKGALVAASRNSFPIVAQHVQRRDHLGVAAGAACALLLGGITFWSMSSVRPAAVTQPSVPLPRVIEQLHPIVAPVPAVPLPVPQTHETGMQPDRLSAPALILDTVPGNPPGSGTPDAGAVPQLPSVERGNNSGIESASAAPMTDPANTIAQGTMIAAVLETAINSDLPGYARAVVSRDVRSFDGSRVLVPRASHLVGQYKSALAGGQKRVYILWSRLIRPDGVSVALSSPATDFSGQTGLTGEVDTHFFARFGSAMLLSAINLLSSVGTAGIVIGGGASSAASVAARSDGQIPPTVSVLPGSPIRVFTARDLDFSTVATEVAQK
jgi:type IV secretion system protein VirB10